MIRKILKKIALGYYKFLLRFSKTDSRKIVFISSVGRNISGNPKAVCQYILHSGNFKEYSCFFITDSKKIKADESLKGCTLVQKNTPAYFRVMASAGTWISDGRLPSYLVKRKDMCYIQTWHGTPLKKLALDMDNVYMSEGKTIEEYKKDFAENTVSWDCLISQNPFSSDIFRRCFAFKNVMLETGYPRNDILFLKNTPEDIKALKRKYNLPEDKKILLYAPTWRDDKYYSNGAYKFVSELDFSQFIKELGDEYFLIIKYHYLVKEKADWSEYADHIKIFKADADISELYLISDALITDYSSVMFDYALLRRPMFFFAYDLENYRDNLRGFYFDFLSEAPGPVSLTTENLISDIKQYDFAEWEEKYNAFQKKYNTFEEGKASEKVAEYILQRKRRKF